MFLLEKKIFLTLKMLKKLIIYQEQRMQDT
jgi:hypothetical protein